MTIRVVERSEHERRLIRERYRNDPPAQPANIPAVVHDYGHRIAAVSHPNDAAHPNVRATIDRLRARGWTIVPFRGEEVVLTK